MCRLATACYPLSNCVRPTAKHNPHPRVCSPLWYYCSMSETNSHRDSTTHSRTYRIPAETLEVVTEVKKSRFITRVSPVRDKQEIKVFLEKTKQDYPDARHHCWAYLLGDPASASSAAMNDDGEPSGTAGKPILNVIQHKEIGDILVVVIRYFGGIKLGAGGLVRAYSGATETALSQIKTERLQPVISYELNFNFDKEQFVRHWLAKHQAEVISVDYRENVLLKTSVPQEHTEALLEMCLGNNVLAKKQV